jgi:hypothetical protein
MTRFLKVLCLALLCLVGAMPAQAAATPSLQALNVTGRDLPPKYYPEGRQVPHTLAEAAKKIGFSPVTLKAGGWVREDDVIYLWDFSQDLAVFNAYADAYAGVLAPQAAGSIYLSDTGPHAHALYTTFKSAMNAGLAAHLGPKQNGLKVRVGSLGDERTLVSLTITGETSIYLLWRHGRYTALLSFVYLSKIAKGLSPARFSVVAQAMDSRIAKASSATE